jgi:hypothetical protein
MAKCAKTYDGSSIISAKIEPPGNIGAVFGVEKTGLKGYRLHSEYIP